MRANINSPAEIVTHVVSLPSLCSIKLRFDPVRVIIAEPRERRGDAFIYD